MVLQTVIKVMNKWENILNKMIVNLASAVLIQKYLIEIWEIIG